MTPEQMLDRINYQLKLLKAWTDNQADDLHDVGSNEHDREDKRRVFETFSTQLENIVEEYELREHFAEVIDDDVNF